MAAPGLDPVCDGGWEAKLSRSRGAFFVRTRAMSGTPMCQKRRRALDLRRMNPAVEGRTHHDRRRRKTGCKSFRTRFRKSKGSRTPTDAVSPACLAASAHPAGRARLSAFHGGSALGTHASQGAASDQVSRSWRHDGGGLPPAPTPVTASTSHAGHSAGGHDVRYRPSATGTNPLRAGTASRSRQPESPSDVLARGARGRRFYSPRAQSQAESFGARFYLIQQYFSPRFRRTRRCMQICASQKSLIRTPGARRRSAPFVFAIGRLPDRRLFLAPKRHAQLSVRLPQSDNMQRRFRRADDGEQGFQW